MLYVTLLDQFHPGIYSSQVIDVCDHLNNKYKAKLRIVAFLSVRELIRSDARKKLKKLSPGAIVFPSFPGLKNFELTAFFLYCICLFTGERKVICRNVFATTMALKVKKWGMLKEVVMDGRSAMAAEIGEYDVFPVEYLRKNVVAFEAYAVNNSDYRIAVSEALISYWRINYNYSNTKHVVIPCTLDTKYFGNSAFNLSPHYEDLRKELGFTKTDIVFVYSGSTAPWQSFTLLEKMLAPILDKDERVKVLFLSKESEDNLRLKERYAGRIIIKWLSHEQVLSYLHCCDYGILFREQSDTNKVASPVKFAEYLYGGLQVVISENLGDFSTFVNTNSCGYVLSEDASLWPEFVKPSIEDKKRSFELACKYYRKESDKNESSYSTLMNYLN
jgi:hypothetical protein